MPITSVKTPPRPWRLYEENPTAFRFADIIAVDETFVFQNLLRDTSPAHSYLMAEVARYVCKAVNNHDVLVEIATAYMEAIEHMAEEEGADVTAIDGNYDHVRAVLVALDGSKLED